jgi:hypothetical protein
MKHASIAMRASVAADIGPMIELFADDTLGCQRENPGTPLNHAYADANDVIAHDTNQASCGSLRRRRITALDRLYSLEQGG